MRRLLLLSLRRLLSPCQGETFRSAQVRTGYSTVPGRTRVEGLSGMSDDADDPPADWRKGHERRVAGAPAPYGLLALTGTRRLADYPEGRIPAVPGSWRIIGASVVPATAPEDSVQLDGEPFTGDAVRAADASPPSRSRHVDEEDGSPWAVFGGAAGGRSGHRLRFLKPEAPTEDGRTTVDSHRALPPSRAFADPFICPFPPPRNTLPFEGAAGERRLKGALAAR